MIALQVSIVFHCAYLSEEIPLKLLELMRFVGVWIVVLVSVDVNQKIALRDEEVSSEGFFDDCLLLKVTSHFEVLEDVSQLGSHKVVFVLFVDHRFWTLWFEFDAFVARFFNGAHFVAELLHLLHSVRVFFGGLSFILKNVTRLSHRICAELEGFEIAKTLGQVYGSRRIQRLAGYRRDRFVRKQVVLHEVLEEKLIDFVVSLSRVY